MTPSCGVGVVWWPELDALCRPAEGLVQVIEAEPETFWAPRADQPDGFTSRLPAALAHLAQPKLLHGVGAPFGGSAMQGAGHRAALAGDIAALRPEWISDHLNFNQFTQAEAPDHAINTGFLMPPAQCRDGVAIAASRIRDRQASTGLPVAFEVPVSYLPPRLGEMADGDFAAAVAREADCGILLDLHNLLCNERNGRQAVSAFCDAIPLDRVWEIHLAGGEAADEWWMDAHCGLVEPALMAMVADLVPRLPCLGAIIFEILPDHVPQIGLDAIGKMLSRLNDIWAIRARSTGPVPPRPAAITTDTMNSVDWERVLGAAVTGMGPPASPDALAEWARMAARPLSLYKTLAQETRASALVDTAPHTILTLLRQMGEARTRDLLARFWRTAAPAYAAADEARAFLRFVNDAALPGLADDIASDHALLDEMVRPGLRPGPAGA